MAFSMKNVSILNSKDGTDRIKNRKKLFGVIKSDSRLTPNIKTALNIYVDYMIKLGATSNYKNQTDSSFNGLDTDRLISMINELLVGCCDEKISCLISRDSVKLVEATILNQIKRAIQRADMNNIYEDEMDSIRKILSKKKSIEYDRRNSIENTRINKKIDNKKLNEIITKEEIKNYLLGE